MALDLLEQILPQVKNHICPSVVPLSDWKIKVGDVVNGEDPSLNDHSWTTIQPPQAQWGAYDTTFWFRSKAVVPPPFAGKPLVIILDIPEGLLFVNGKPYHGLDQNHGMVYLTDKGRANQLYSLAIQAYSGRTKEAHTFSRADLAVLNPTARSLFSGLQLLKELEKLAGQGAQEQKDVRELIRRTLVFLKYFKPEGEEYPNAIGRAHRFLMQALESEFRTDIPALVHLVGQSHIDVAWLWTLRETRRKAGRTFSSALRLMDEFPEFKFTQSQPVLYEFVKDDYPDLYRQIKQRVTEGRWEVVGSTWLEPDCNIPNGESLIRQILHGKKYIKNEFGIDSDILWLPDTFGYTWSLPQILRKSGISFFLTTKLSWNDTTKFPHTTFWWKGIDGTKILAHLPPVGLEGQVNPKDIKKSWEGFQQKDHQTDALQTYGYGDGGGGPSKEQLSTLPFLKSFPTFPQVKISTAAEFFRTIAEKSKDLPVYESELYLERHRGTYTTQAWMKKEHREAERAIADAELLATVATLNGAKKYPQTELEAAWKLLLLQQFHDILPGTSIPEVYEDARTDFDRLRRTVGDVTRSSLAFLSKPLKKSSREFHFSLVNTLPWNRSEYIELTVRSSEKRFSVTDDHGHLVEHQVVNQSKGTVTLVCYAPSIPPYSTRSLTVKPLAGKPEPPADAWKLSSRVLETPIYRIRIDTQGNFTSLYHKALRREVFQKGERGNTILTYHDLPQQWEAWDIDPNYESKRVDLLKFKSFRIIEQGPIRLTIEVVRKSDHGSLFTQHIMFYHKLPRVDFKTHVKWLESQILVKAALPLNVNTSLATYEIQCGALQRTTKPKTPAEKAKYEVPGQQWADMSDQKFGVSLLNDSKYGYDASGQTLRLTLLRSPRYPHPTDPLKLADPRPTDQGEHSFTYCLQPHSGDWKKGETIRRARELNHPPLVWESSAIRIVAPLFTLSSPGVVVSAVKKAEEGTETIVRLYEGHGETTKATLDFGYGLDQAYECDLLENQVARLKPTRGRLSLKFSPFEIKTLKLKLRPKKAR